MPSKPYLLYLCVLHWLNWHDQHIKSSNKKKYMHVCLWTHKLAPSSQESHLSFDREEEREKNCSNIDCNKTMRSAYFSWTIISGKLLGIFVIWMLYAHCSAHFTGIAHHNNNKKQKNMHLFEQNNWSNERIHLQIKEINKRWKFRECFAVVSGGGGGEVFPHWCAFFEKKVVERKRNAHTHAHTHFHRKLHIKTTAIIVIGQCETLFCLWIRIHYTSSELATVG